MPVPSGTDRPREVLFRSRDLLVAKVVGFSRDRCIVTFASFTDRRTLDREGFGEEFLRSRGVDAVHVISRDNDWWQYREIGEAMAAVRAAAQPYGRVVTYGSSMGGYAAIRLAGLAGAHCALALSPQFSILRRAAPFEYRWPAEARRLRPVWEGKLPFPRLPECYVLYDPANIDAQHAARIAASCPTIPVYLRGAGHQTATFLLEVGLLQDAVLAASRGPLDVPTLEAEAWRRRRRSAQHWLALAARVRPQSWQLALVRRAVELAPGNAALKGILAVALGRAGRFAEALDAHRAALALEPGHPVLLSEHAATLEASGDARGALAILEGLVGGSGLAEYTPRLERLRGLVAAGDRAPVRGAEGAEGAGSAVPSLPPAGAMPILSEPGQKGFVLYGPYLELQPGRYEVEFTVSARSGPARFLGDRRIACVLDVTIHAGRTVLARRRLSVGALRSGDGTYRLQFRLSEWTGCEFRVFATGAAGLVVQPARPCRRVEAAPRP